MCSFTQLKAEKQKDVIEAEIATKTETDELGVGAASEFVETKPTPVTMTQIVKLIADVHTLNKIVSIEKKFVINWIPVYRDCHTNCVHTWYDKFQMPRFYESGIKTHIQKLGIQSTQILKGKNSYFVDIVNIFTLLSGHPYFTANSDPN